MRIRLLVGIAVLEVLLIGSTTFAEVRYDVTLIGTFGGGHSAALAINRGGVVTGVAGTPQQYLAHAFRLSSEGLRDVTPDSTGLAIGQGIGINDAGQVVGSILPVGAGDSKAFYFDGVNTSELAGLGYGSTEASAINNLGQIVGTSQIGDRNSVFHAFLIAGSEITDLAIASSREMTDAGSINDVGQIAGAYLASDQREHACIYRLGGEFTDVHPPGTLSSVARAVSENGDVIGSYVPADVSSRFLAYLRTGTGAIIELTPGANESQAQGVNDHDDVVGTVLFTGDPGHWAYLHDASGLHNLNDLISPDSGWTLIDAYDINNAGQIVGSGEYDPDGPGGLHAMRRGFILTPVPEPASCAAMCLATVLLSARRRQV